jgi:subtilisin-like proprotein convertase family protein
MRLEPNGGEPQGAKGWSRIRARERRNRTTIAGEQRTRRRVRLESVEAEYLELRQLMAVLPAPLKPSELQTLFDPNTGTFPFAGIQNVYSPTVNVGAGGIVSGQIGSINAGEPSTNISSPILSVNPLNPNHQVVVAQLNNVPLFGSTVQQPQRVIGFVTQNGGQTWTQLTLPPPQSDPTVTTNPPNMRVQDISAAIDRNGDIYVTQSQVNSGGNAGLLQMRKFNAAGVIIPPVLPATETLYAWNRTIAGFEQQQGRLKPFVVVNTNPATFTDPVTGQTQNDPGSGNVYVAYITETPLASPPSPYNPFSLRMQASNDGGASFGPEVTVGSGSGAPSMQIARLAVGPGGGATPGRVTLVWDNYNSQSGSPTPTAILSRSYSVAGNVLTSVAGPTTIANTALIGANAQGQYPALTNITGEGVGAAPVVAVDATLGSFSPHKGRIYVAYASREINITGNPADNVDVYIQYSDNGGVTWSPRAIINDDAGNADGFSGSQYEVNPFSPVTRNGVGVTPRGGRPQFLPSITVDQSTGTVAVSYLDARYDPAKIRVTNSVQTSIDGGATFSASTTANLEANPTNLITGDTVLDIPIPDNQGTANPVRDAFWGFGLRSSIQAYAGAIYPAWSFNVNAGYSTDNNAGANVALIRGNIGIGRMYVSAGPRIIASTMGQARSWTAGGATFNNTFDAAGVQGVNGLTFTFDRAVDPASVTPAAVVLTYTDILGNKSVVPVNSVTPIAASITPFGATQFFAQFNAQYDVGTYSYEIRPGAIRDSVRTVNAGGFVRLGNSMDQDNIPDRFTGSSTSYATPAPLNPLAPGAPPYDNATLPLIVSGPYVANTELGYFSPTTGAAVIYSKTSTGELLALNAGPNRLDNIVQFVDVVFDRNMNPSTFTVADILEMRGPAGLITSGFTITPNPNGTDPDPAFPRTFRVEFPNQRLSGQYSMVLGADIASSTGVLMDSNRNAGLYVLRGESPSGPVIPQTFATTTAVPITAGSQASPSVSRMRLSVAESFLIKNFATAKINVSFPRDLDLTGYLVAPDGSRTLLFANVGQAGTGANFTETVFDDTALTPIQNGGAPFFGRFRPVDSLLNNLLNINVQGDWYLEIQNAGQFTGTINSLSIDVGQQITGTGLGEPVADRSTLDFRVFTMREDNPLSADQWVAVGPAGINNGTQPASPVNPQLGGTTTNSGAGRVSTITLDPSDPSGNTVFIGAGTGGIFKTTNFLTDDPRGPIWQDLTGFGPTNSLNSGTIAIFGRNANPDESVVIVGTGEPGMLNPPPYGQTTTPNTAAGVGFLLSPDGGDTWRVLDSTNNYDAQGNYLPLDSPLRDRVFVGSTIQKIVVDPRPTTTGEIIMYAAVYNPNTPNANGIWRSTTSGRSWQRMRAGAATDIALDPSSGVVDAVSNPAGNLQIAYAAFQGEGVFLSNNRGLSWFLMSGGVGKPLWRDAGPDNNQQVVVANNPSPNGGFGRILIAKPTLTLNATQDVMYSGWLYAVVSNPGNSGIQGVYVTKDFGQNWTQIQLRTMEPLNGFIRSVATNSTADGSQVYNFGFNESSYALSLTIDPTNPEVIYLGGSFGGVDETGQPESMIRVDISRMNDANAFFMGNYGNDGGAIQPNTTNGIDLEDPVNSGVFPFAPPYDPRRFTYTNLYRNPQGLLDANSSIPVYNTAGIANTGLNARWTPFGNNPSDISFGSSLLGNTAGVTAGSNAYGGNSIQQLITTVDPLTGKARVIAVTNTGVYSGLDKGDGTLIRSIGNVVNDSATSGNVAIPTGSRNGNLQNAQLYSIAAQPSDVAAQVSGSLFYAMTQRNGFPASTVDILETGDVTWSVPLDPFTGLPVQQLGGGSDVQANPNGGVYDANGNIDSSNMLYQWGWPFASLNTQTNFFQVGQNYDNSVGRTFGLFQTNQGPRWPDPQWARMDGGKFAVNPINGRQMLIGSTVGRVFATNNAGNFWLPVAEPAAVGGSRSTALAFGAPQPSDPSADTNFYLFNGTAAGGLYVTFSGGGGGANPGFDWINRSAGLDGTAIMDIIPNPERGSREAFVVTQRGVYWKADMADPASWTNVTGNLFSLRSNAFGDADQSFSLMSANTNPLTSLVVDWRYEISADLTNLTGPTHPILYVAGRAGVFRSLDKGSTWVQFPPLTDGSTADGGYLPNVIVTDLDIVIGNIDPATGKPNMAAPVINPLTGLPDTAVGPNILVASTYGRGAYAIRLAPFIFQQSVRMSNTAPEPAPVGSDSGRIDDPFGRPAANNTIADSDRITSELQPVFSGLSEQSAFGNVVTINLYDLSAYTPADYADGVIPAGAPLIGTAQTDADGRFSVQVIAGYFQNDGTTDGLKSLGLQAVNQSGTIGNIATTRFRLDTTEPAAPGPLTTVINAGSGSAIQANINVAGLELPPYGPVVPGLTVLTSFVRLYRGEGEGPHSFGQLTLVAAGTAAAGATSINLLDPNLLQPDTTYTYYATQYDTAGNVSALSQGIVVDTTRPAAPFLDPDDDSGIKGDNITNVTRPHLEGFTRANSTVQFFEVLSSGTVVPLGSAPSDAAGFYRFQVPNVLSDGPHTFYVTVINSTGGVSLPSSTLTIVIDTRIPNVPVPTINLDPTFDSGTKGDLITNSRRPRFFGVAERNQDVLLQISRQDDPLATFYVYASARSTSTNSYNFQVPFQVSAPAGTPPSWWVGDAANPGLADGVYLVRAQVHTVAGNTADSNVLTLTIDTSSPDAPPPPTLAPNADTGIVGDFVTSQRRPTFISSQPILTSPAGTVVELIDSRGSVIGRGVLDASGQYAIQVTQIFYNGTIDLRVRLVDFAGNVSPASTPIRLTVISVPDDYNGDGLSDFPLYDRSTSTMRVMLNGNPFPATPVYLTQVFAGVAPDAKVIPVAGDFDGDGRTDPALYDQTTGNWLIYRSTFGFQVLTLPANGLPSPADFDGDGVTDPAVYNQTTQIWTYVLSTQLGIRTENFGAPNAMPIAANYTGFDADGRLRADFAVTYVDGANRVFKYKDPVTGLPVIQNLGGSASIPVPADYDLDFKTDIAVVETTADNRLLWTIALSGGTVTTLFGDAGDIPVPSDYNGDGKAEVAVYKPVNAGGGGIWSYDQTPAVPNVVSRVFGIADAVPVNSPLIFRLPPVSVPTPPDSGNGNGSGSGDTGGSTGGGTSGGGTSTPPAGGGGPSTGSGSSSGGGSPTGAGTGAGNGGSTGSGTVVTPPGRVPNRPVPKPAPKPRPKPAPKAPPKPKVVVKPAPKVVVKPAPKVVVKPQPKKQTVPPVRVKR